MGIAQKFLDEQRYNSLLEPLSKGRLPQHLTTLPRKYRKSWAYQEPKTGQYFIGTFAPLNIAPHPSDTLHNVEGGEIGRPDIISYRHYKTPDLYWVILWINNILDPFETLYPGMVLRIPTLQRLMELGVAT